MKQKVTSLENIFLIIKNFLLRKEITSDKLLMNVFTIRIQLENIKNDTSVYKTLHDKMLEYKFKNTILLSDKIEYFLPDAEYNYKGKETLEQVMKNVIKVIEDIEYDAQVLITESKNIMMYNAKKIKKSKGTIKPYKAIFK
ncbi:hypothetical protein [Leptospira interrogans]|uniref:hypothetical protein n=1 Tax=Leptospira interrogans TaxID=173 RepID=UPI00027858BC|nr:hypothetical protein [Leptospira interrogans]EJP16568.1 hypothetical protein LEP1GSC080_0647 [Leptospira interrogans str. FPW2026]